MANRTRGGEKNMKARSKLKRGNGFGSAAVSASICSRVFGTFSRAAMLLEATRSYSTGSQLNPASVGIRCRVTACFYGDRIHLIKFDGCNTDILTETILHQLDGIRPSGPFSGIINYGNQIYAFSGG